MDWEEGISWALLLPNPHKARALSTPFGFLHKVPADFLIFREPADAINEFPLSISAALQVRRFPFPLLPLWQCLTLSSVAQNGVGV